MYSKNLNKFRILFLIASLMLLIFTANYFLKRETNECIGIKFLNDDNFYSDYNYEYKDLSQEIIFDGEMAPVDINSSTIYLPQKINKETNISNLSGALACTNNKYNLYFANDNQFEDLNNAVANGHEFKLYIMTSQSTYMIYNVVFTTLPVMRINGEYSYEDIENRPIMSGEMCLWPSNFFNDNPQCVKKSKLEWRIRGQSSSLYEKKPWKLNLKMKSGDNNKVDLLNIGKDDDWILNPMSMDDLKIREKLFMDLWNLIQEEYGYSPRMSTGEYIELVLNGKYHGLYLLQKRIDQNYLNLNGDDICFKGKQAAVTSEMDNNFEIVCSPFNDDYTYEILKNVWNNLDSNNVDIENLIDTYLFLQFASASDNCEYKNMYYILRCKNNDYSLATIPWDTDVSFGLIWDQDFVYDLERSLNLNLIRPEMNCLIKNSPNVVSMIKKRWMELSSDILSKNYVLNEADELYNQIKASGSLEREIKNWGLRYENDNYKNFLQFINYRFAYLNDLFMNDCNFGEK